jgi:hypothetical protein
MFLQSLFNKIFGSNKTIQFSAGKFHIFLRYSSLLTEGHRMEMTVIVKRLEEKLFILSTPLRLISALSSIIFHLALTTKDVIML